MVLTAIVSLSAALGAILVVWFVPPTLQLSAPPVVITAQPVVITAQPVVITQAVPVLVTVEMAQNLTCPTATAPECPPVVTPESVVIIATATPVLTRLTMEQISNQTQRVADPSTGKVSVDQEGISGYFYNGNQRLGSFNVANDHLTKRSSFVIDFNYPYGNRNTPDGVRFMIEFYQSALPQVEQLLKYEVR
jgi:hypothetical protein